MLIKAKRLLCISLLFCAQQLVAQNVTRSPYSSLGLGELQFTGSAWMGAMGQVSQGISSPFTINNQNPASYGSLQLTTFDVAGSGAVGKMTTATASSTVRTASYGYFALGMPLSQKLKWGASFGLMPFTSVGYNITRNVSQPTFTGTEQVTGRGGLSRFYLGTGIKVYKGLSAGVNASYLYGQLKHTLFLDIPAEYSMYNIVEERNRYVGDMYYDLGLQYTDTFVYKEEKFKWGAGITFSPETNLSASDDYNVRTLPIGSKLSSGSAGYGKDTAANVSNAKGTVVMPMVIKGGIHLQQIDKWSVSIDAGYYNWANYRAFGRSDSLKNTLSLGIGLSIIPNATAIKGYLKKIEYRAGARYDNGNLKVNGQSINTYAVSAGLGLPMGRVRSRLNLTAEYMVRGTTSERLVREEYFRFTVGVIICDKWFYRYRYD